MDKYEYHVRIEQIQSLLEEERYSDAMAVCDEIDWKKEKKISMLINVSRIYRYNKRYEDARAILNIAYDRYPGDREVVYELCELAIRMREVVAAQEFYKEYCNVAPKDPMQYILKYKIFEFLDTSLEERISVLEEFKRKDNYSDDRWAYELAYLYYKIGLYAKCADECDELITWFGQGEYVLKAMELKRLIKPLNSRQQSLYNAMTGHMEQTDGAYGDEHDGDEIYSDGSDMDNTSDETYDDEEEFIPTTADEDSIEVRTLNVDKYSTMNIQDELSNSVQEFFEGEGVRVKEESEEYYPENDGGGYEEAEEYYSEDEIADGDADDETDYAEDAVIGDDADTSEEADDLDVINEFDSQRGETPEKSSDGEYYEAEGFEEEDSVNEPGIYDDVQMDEEAEYEDGAAASDENPEEYYDGEEGPFEDENGEIYYLINGEVYYEDELYYPEDEYSESDDGIDDNEYDEEYDEEYEIEKADTTAEDERPVVEKMSEEEIIKLSQNREKKVLDIREAASRDIAMLSNTGRLIEDIQDSDSARNENFGEVAEQVLEPLPDEEDAGADEISEDEAIVKNVESEVPVRLLETEEIFSDEIEELIDEEKNQEELTAAGNEIQLKPGQNENVYQEMSDRSANPETADETAEQGTTDGSANPETAEQETVDKPAEREAAVIPEEKSGTAKLAEIVGNARQAEIDNNSKLVNALKNEKRILKPSFREIVPNADGTNDKNMEKMLSQDSDGQLSLVVPDQEAVDKQITGQMNLDSFLVEWEKQNRENQRNRIAAAKRKSLEQTNDILSQLKGVIPDLSAPLPTLEELAREITLPDENVQEKSVREETVPEVKRMPIASKPKTKKISEPETPKDNLKVRSTSVRKNAEELLKEPTVGKVIMPPEEKPIYKTRAEQLEDDRNSFLAEEEYDENAVPKDDFETGHLPRTDEEEVFMANLDDEYLDEYQQSYEVSEDGQDDGSYLDDEPYSSGEDYGEDYPSEESYENKTYLADEPYEEVDYMAEEDSSERTEVSGTSMDIMNEDIYEEDSYGEEFQESGYAEQEPEYAEAGYAEQEPEYAEAGYAEAGYAEQEPEYAEAGYAEQEPEYAESGYAEQEPEYAEAGYAEQESEYAEAEYLGQGSDYTERDEETLGFGNLGYKDEDYEATPYPGEQEGGAPGYLDDEDEAEDEEDVSDSSDLEEFFAEFLDMRNMKKKLREALPLISMNPIEGNVVLTGNESSVRVKLALAIAKSIQAVNPEFTGRIAKVDAETLNTKDIRRAFNAMNNGAVVIEQAGKMTVNTLNTMAKCINHSSVRILLILEDEKSEIRKLEKLRGYFSRMFNVTISVPTYSNNELVDYAKRYALVSECVIDEMGVLALFKRIDDMQTSDHYVTIEEVEDIIDKAINSAEKKSLAHFKDVLFAKRYDDDDNLIIRERDFE